MPGVLGKKSKRPSVGQTSLIELYKLYKEIVIAIHFDSNEPQLA